MIEYNRCKGCNKILDNTQEECNDENCIGKSVKEVGMYKKGVIDIMIKEFKIKTGKFIPDEKYNKKKEDKKFEKIMKYLKKMGYDEAIVEVNKWTTERYLYGEFVEKIINPLPDVCTKCILFKNKKEGVLK